MKIIADYIWLDNKNNLRSKIKVFENEAVLDINSYPMWNYDGSSTGQADTENSEVILKPVRVVKDYINYKDNTYLVLCETYIKSNNELVPHTTNTRNIAVNTFNNNPENKPMYGLELEFFLYKNNLPLSMPKYPNISLKPQGDYYCGVGGLNIFSRDLMLRALDCALKTNIGITGMNAEVAPGQWEFQVCNYGIDACDDFILFRYILERICERDNIDINYDPKPVNGDWNGSGCHINFSTENMREGSLNGKKGIDFIYTAIKRLENKHKEHMEIYGENNDKRLTGIHETAKYNEFSYGVANRGCSIRIPQSTIDNEKGYFEDRRPSSNIDPYLVCSKIYQTCCL